MLQFQELKHVEFDLSCLGHHVHAPWWVPYQFNYDFAHTFDKPEEEEPAEEKSSRKSTTLIAGIAGVVLIAGAIGFFALNEKDHTKKEQQTSAIDKTDPPEINPETTAKTYATWEEYEAASQAEGWHYDIAEYVGVVPDEENFSWPSRLVDCSTRSRSGASPST